MYRYTENLSGWEKEQPTNACFLPGNYFFKSLMRYPGTMIHPLIIRKNRKGKYYVHMRENKVDTEYPGLLRVVIETPKTRHSNLLIIDFNNGKVFRFEPLGKSAENFNEVNSLIEGYLSMFFDFDMEVIDIELDEILDEKNPKCKNSGFCAAYVILYAYSYLNGIPFNPYDIRRFATKIEKTYGSIPYNEVEVEYGLFTGGDTNTGRNMLIGGLAGAGIGGLVGGGQGLLLGGLGGAAIGGLI